MGAEGALGKARRPGRWGNPTYRKGARNSGPPMCSAAKLTIVQVEKIVGLGDIDPDHVVTPSIFVDRIVEVADPISEAKILLGREKPRWIPPHERKRQGARR